MTGASVQENCPDSCFEECFSCLKKGTKKKATSILHYAHFNVFFTLHLMSLSPPPANAS